MKITKETDRVSRLEYISTLHKYLGSVVKRDYDAKRLNHVANHPDVYRWVKGSFNGYLDLTPIVQDQRNILLMGEYGGVMFVNHQPGFYEAHTQMLPEGRGEWALWTVRAALHWMFTHTEAVEIMTKVPKGNLGARALVRSIHGKFEFRRENGWVLDGQSVPADIYSLTIQDWMRTAEGLTERGEWFHNKLEKELSQGLGIPDPIYLRYVGATVETMLANQPQKATVLYSRWAAMSGYTPIRILTENPLVIDIGGTLIAVRNDDFWVMNVCQSPHH